MAEASSNVDPQQTHEDDPVAYATEIDVPETHQVIQNIELQIASSESSISANSATTIELDQPSFHFIRNGIGQTLHIEAARRAKPLADALLSGCNSEAAIIRSQHDGWTPLHISTIKNDADVVKYILENITDESEKHDFINQVDNLGWTSLHWGAVLDNAEAFEETMSRMSISHQHDVMLSNWTLLHATAVGDAVNSMEVLMGKFKDENIKWKILTCSTEDGRTALHIAVAEGNTRAAIMLTDIMSAQRADLISIQDSEGNTANNYASRFPLLGEYLELATRFRDPILSVAARNDDKHLVSWILEHSTRPHTDLINEKSEDGLTVLQAASKLNNLEVVREIVKTISEDELVKCIKQESDDGETVLHIAVNANNPLIIHTLLKAVKLDHHLKMLMKMENSAGENAVQMAGKLNRQHIGVIFDCCTSMSAEKLVEYLETFEHSLFALKLSKENVKTRYDRIETLGEHDLGVCRNANFNATICLIYGDLDQARYLTEDVAAKADRDDIHMWCNRGMLALKQNPPQYGEAERAALRIIELLTEESSRAGLKAKIYYAFGMAEGHRTAEARAESHELFSFCVAEANRNADDKMIEYCSYYFLKFLVRYIRSDDRYSHGEEWIRDKMNDVTDQLITLSKSSDKQMHGHMWLWLTEILLTKIPAHIVSESMNNIRREIKSRYNSENYDLDAEVCLKKAVDIGEKELVKDRKFMARISKNCLYVAYDCGNAELRERWLQLAFRYSEDWMRKNDWLHMCASTSAQAQIQLWAMEFYSQHRTLVEEEYLKYCNQKLDTGDKAWRYLIESYYSTDVMDDGFTREKLQPVKCLLSEIIERNKDWASYGVKYARIKCLVGDPQQEIDEAFKKAIKFCEPGSRRAGAYQNCGYYNLITGRVDEAERLFNKAKEECDSGKAYKLFMAKNGLRMIHDRWKREDRQRRYW